MSMFYLLNYVTYLIKSHLAPWFVQMLYLLIQLREKSKPECTVSTVLKMQLDPKGLQKYCTKKEAAKNKAQHDTMN